MDKPAFPTTQTKDDIRGNHDEIFNKWHPGLTKREYFAGQAMVGLLSHPKNIEALGISAQKSGVGPTVFAALCACEYADALIKELNRGEGK